MSATIGADRLPRSVTAPSRWAMRRQAERAQHLRTVGRLMDPGGLPQSVAFTPGVDWAARARSARMVAGWLMLFPLLFWLVFGIGDAYTLLAPLALPGLAGAIAFDAGRRARFLPARMEIALSPEAVTLTTERGVWTTPIRDFGAVALRRRTRKEYVGRVGSTGHRTATRQGSPYIVHEFLWIELAHADPERSVPIWAVEGRDDERRLLARETAARFAEVLGLPLVSGAGIGPTGRFER